MRVKELIKGLSEMDPNLRVVVRGYEDGVTDVDWISEIRIQLNKNKEWWEGPHRTALNTENFDEMAVYIHGFERRES